MTSDLYQFFSVLLLQYSEGYLQSLHVDLQCCFWYLLSCPVGNNSDRENPESFFSEDVVITKLAGKCVSRHYLAEKHSSHFKHVVACYEYWEALGFFFLLLGWVGEGGFEKVWGFFDIVWYIRVVCIYITVFEYFTKEAIHHYEMQ